MPGNIKANLTSPLSSEKVKIFIFGSIVSNRHCNLKFDFTMSFYIHNMSIESEKAILYVGCLFVFSILWFYSGKTLRGQFPRVGKNPWIHGLANARNDFLKNGRALTEEGYRKVIQFCITSLRRFLRTTVSGLDVCCANCRHGTSNPFEFIS